MPGSALTASAATRRRPAVDGAPAPPFDPSQISAIVAWLRVAQATASGGLISSVPDVINTNPAAQPSAGRQPVQFTSANGLACVTIAGDDCLVWPITAQSSAAALCGYGFWMRRGTLAATNRIIRVGPGTNGASGNRIGIQTSLTSLTGFVAITTNANTKNADVAVLSAGWHFVTIEYNGAMATDATRLVITVDGVVQTLVFTGAATLGPDLAPATGNILLGNNNDGSGSQSLQGEFGPNIYAFGAAMPGATEGVLTASGRASLMAFEAPT